MTGDRAAPSTVTWRRVLAGELDKAVRTRSVQVLVVLELCVVGFFSSYVGVPGVQAACVPAGLAGIVIGGAEYASGAIMPTVVAVGSRSRLFWAQLVCAAAVPALPALMLMLGLALTTRPYMDYQSVPFDLATSLEAVVRAGLVLALASAAGALLSMGTRLVATASIIFALAIGGAQVMSAVAVSLLMPGRGAALLYPVYAVTPNAVLARLQGVANTPSIWLEEPAVTVLLAVAWCLPLFLWGYRSLTRKDF
ncbi:hypothetical protein D4740_04050 [Actinomyces sp. 2119]|uniref:ABC transporter permease n=1 Tax=Actinomyces lilanjuaniae TaxID=2321394 RepID=A0ABM6Z2T3_9ACTO|nr:MULTISPECIES: hypothetical protein [Actinomyces]AYD89577.1 hypothetical protein D5R93_05015 [Actinomyces lilanjuaniae]RJF43057.1 hypothetical protein D4740_04050 [Actinomyces sp. 2119]